ncbi:Tol-Pal system beta propeller repeat protein TolB [Gammaproteobacteria bacterium 45_16_T64]|nr:Tol-Pal system beta propeller repeat protein TolB [Gammaproteobacteria bacterium 45_16_T64]
MAFGIVVISSAVRAELVVEVTKGSDEAQSIAVVPFSWSGPGRLSTDIARVVSADLHRSGQFKPIARDKMLSRPSTQDQVFFRDWRVLGTEFVVIGRVEKSAKGVYQVEFELLDVLQGKVVKRGSAAGKKLRAMSHYISDVVYEYLTGIKGAFSTHLVYVTMEWQKDNKQLFKLHHTDADGFNDVVIFTDAEPILSPSWAPNGRDITYVSFEGTRPGIYIQNTLTGKRQKITGFPGLNSAPSFSPDSRKLAMVLSKDGNPEIYTMDLSSGRLTRLTRYYGIDTEPSWSPDGQSIIFTSNRGGSPQIYRVQLASLKVERLTFEGNYNARPSITPDGRFLVMVHRRDGVFNIAVQDLVRGSFDVLTETTLDESPSVAPNGVMVIYATQRQGKGVLEAVSMDKRVKVRLPSSKGHVREPAWSPFLY